MPKKREDRPMNPQRTAFKENFLNPNSETFGNAKQSAIKAGFSPAYANAILSKSTGNAWVEEIIRDYEIVNKAEKVLAEMLEMATTNVVERGEEIVLKVDPGLVKIKQDTAKFIAERLKKEKWSVRTEHTGAGGENLMPNELVIKKINDVLDNYLGNECEKTN
jgi:phage terminase small subunit